ncbi:MAG: TraR/DksA family transcriptional regulator [Gammaproteobacteria bacterium]
MVDVDLSEMREALLKLREELESVAATNDESSRIVELDQTRVGRLSRMDALQAQAMAKEFGRRSEILLQKIAGALERVENGDYGLCRSCDNPIPRKRLEFDPTTLLCIQCAERAERS